MRGGKLPTMGDKQSGSNGTRTGTKSIVSRINITRGLKRRFTRITPSITVRIFWSTLDHHTVRITIEKKT